MDRAEITTTKIREIKVNGNQNPIDMTNIDSLFHRIDEETQPTEFVGGIFPRRHVSIISSKAGVGKTWYILKFITDLSKGGTIFLSQAYYEPPRTSLVFCGETGVQLLTERQRVMRDRANTSLIHIVSKLEAARRGLLLNINTIDGIQAISFLSKKVKPDCIVFDTLMSFRDDDENTAQDTTLMMSRLQALADNLNCAVIVTHHLRKSQAQGDRQRIDQDEIIGSSALVRQCGVAYILVKHDVDIYALKPVKTWWENQTTIIYRMFKDNGLITFELPRDENWTNARLRVEEFIKKQTHGETFTALEICEKFKIPKATCYRIFEKYCVKAVANDNKDFRYRYKGSENVQLNINVDNNGDSHILTNSGMGE